VDKPQSHRGDLNLDETLAALRRFALDAQAQEQAARDAREIRDRLIVGAYDAGYTRRQVCTAGLISTPRLNQILAKAG
jgi:hypothetical protein